MTPPATVPTKTADLPLGRWEGIVFMATGLALVVHILIDVPLWLSVITTVAAATGVLVIGARRHPYSRDAGRDVLKVAAVAAFAGLIAYDGTRVLIAETFDYHVKPYEAFKHFGAGLLGESASSTARWTAGTIFHVVNAITFGIAYTVLAGRQPTKQRAVGAGVIFGLGLEAAMLAFYPGWLQIRNMREFVSMSVVGHIAFGATLGLMAYRGLERLEGRVEGPVEGQVAR